MGFFKKISKSFNEALYDTVITHDGIEHAGYLAFLGLLALFPFLVFLVAIAGFIGQGEVGLRFIDFLMANLPEKAALALAPRVTEITSGPPQGLLTVSILGAIWTASSAVEGVRTILNRAYRVGTPPAYWFRRLMSLLQFLIFTFTIVVAMILVVFAPLAILKIEALFNISLALPDGSSWHDTIVMFSGFVMFMVVANIYYILPNIRQTIMEVVPGAALTVVGWIGAAALFALYLSKFDQVNLIYGSLGGIIATLLFFYIANIIFIFGAELNYHLSTNFGHFHQEKIHVETEPDCEVCADPEDGE